MDLARLFGCLLCLIGSACGSIGNVGENKRSAGAFRIDAKDVLTIVKTYGYRDRAVSGAWQNPSGTMLFIWDKSASYPPDVYVIAKDHAQSRVYKGAKWNWFNDDGSPFGCYFPSSGVCTRTDGSLVPSDGVKYQALASDGIVHYVAAYDSNRGETSIFDIGSPGHAIASFSDFYPLQIRSRSGKIYLFGYTMRQSDDFTQKGTALIFELDHGQMKLSSKIDIPGQLGEMIPGTERIVVASEVLPTLWRGQIFDLNTKKTSYFPVYLNGFLLCAPDDWVTPWANSLREGK